ncbi:UDP-glucuronosyltransferase 2B13-like isoform X2 [Anoplophora glabripennis]|nr:UDP-glucuronosyltransferase 2B13-like isoform X2 [Anoplophora glabripennis]
MRKYFNVSIQMKELLDEVSMIFLNSHPVIHGRRPFSPGTISVNYRRNFPVYELLDMSVNKLVDSAKEGFIYFSLGSNLKASQLNKDLLEAIIETLGKLPYKILFKYEGDYLPEKPDNVKIVKWVPQLRILNHPNIKLFVTQGGRQSTEEAIYASVSMV